MLTPCTRHLGRRRRKRPGFALTETIAAIVILSVGLLPMLWAIREAHVQRANPVLASRARWLAVEKLEDVIADRHSSTRGYAYLLTANYPPEPAVAGFPTFGRTVSLVETQADLGAPSPGGGYMNVTVSVTWTDAAGKSLDLRVTTVLTEYPTS